MIQSRSDFKSIFDVYEEMLIHNKPVISENAGSGSKDLNDKGAADIQPGGPTGVEGYMSDYIDGPEDDADDKFSAKHTQKKGVDTGVPSKSTKSTKKKAIEADTSEEDNEEISEESAKIVNKLINKVTMKSDFNKLYEQFLGDQGVDDDLNELGAFDSEFGGEDEDLGGEGEDEVTIKLPRDKAQILFDALKAVLDVEVEGDDEPGAEDDLGDDMSDDVFGEEDEEGEVKEAPTSFKDGKQNKVGSVKPKGGTANTKVTDKVGFDADHGHALHGAKAPNMGKQNKVGGIKQGQDLFQ